MAKIVPEEEEEEVSPSSTMLFEVVDHGIVLLPSLEEEDEELSEGSLFSIDIDLHHDRDHDHDRVEDHNDRIYVAVGKNNSESSMDALLWTLKHATISSSSTIVYLVHVFPVIRLIPSPCKFLTSSSVILAFELCFACGRPASQKMNCFHKKHVLQGRLILVENFSTVDFLW